MLVWLLLWMAWLRKVTALAGKVGTTPLTLGTLTLIFPAGCLYHHFLFPVTGEGSWLPHHAPPPPTCLQAQVLSERKGAGKIEVVLEKTRRKVRRKAMDTLGV